MLSLPSEACGSGKEGRGVARVGVGQDGGLVYMTRVDLWPDLAFLGPCITSESCVSVLEEAVGRAEA